MFQDFRIIIIKYYNNIIVLMYSTLSEYWGTIESERTLVNFHESYVLASHPIPKALLHTYKYIYTHNIHIQNVQVLYKNRMPFKYHKQHTENGKTI